MHTFRRHLPVFLLVTAALLLGTARLHPLPAPNTNPRIIVTVEPQRKAPAAELRPGDVIVRQERDPVAVTNLTPLAGTPLQLYVAVDDTLGTNFGPFLTDVRKFINSLPANAAVGVVYLRNGGLQIRQEPTTDHNAAANALRIPVANVGTSPFESITELLKRWPESPQRREIVFISTGIQPFGPQTVSNPFVDQAVSAAQRQVVPVFAIYLPAPGHWGHTFWRTTWAETFMSRIGDETGGEAYNTSPINITSMEPFFDDINQRLQRQYHVAFTPKPQKKAGFQQIRVTSEQPNIDLVAQDRVWIGGAE